MALKSNVRASLQDGELAFCERSSRPSRPLPVGFGTGVTAQLVTVRWLMATHWCLVSAPAGFRTDKFFLILPCVKSLAHNLHLR